MIFANLHRFLLLLVAVIASFALTGCDFPQVRAEDRIFPPLQISFIGEYQLLEQTVDGTRVGGLSGITYDRQRDQFYAISDDRSQFAPARFYTLKLQLEPGTGQPAFKVQPSGVTRLKNSRGEAYPEGKVDPEGIALTPKDTVFISSEGVQGQALPFVDEFNQSGTWQQALTLPPYFSANPKPDAPPQGVQNNLGFESLTIAPQGDRLFTATESALFQDLDPANPEPIRARLLHYLLGEPRPELISEHLYVLEPKPEGFTFHGLVELLAVDNGGHFLSLERSFSPTQGMRVKLFQMATGAATDIRGMETVKGGLGGIQPVRKQLLFDLNTLGIRLDNLEGMAFGPRLPDGSQSLLVVGDNNFQSTNSQFLLFRVNSKRPTP
jgi:hypothetical protein